MFEKIGVCVLCVLICGFVYGFSQFFGPFYGLCILFGLSGLLFVYVYITELRDEERYEEVIRVHGAVSKDAIEDVMISRSIKMASVKKKTDSVILTDKESSRLYLLKGSSVSRDIDDGSLFLLRYEEVIQVHDAVSKDEIKNFMISKSIKTASVQKKTKSVILTDKDSSKLYLLKGKSVSRDIYDGSLFFNT